MVRCISCVYVWHLVVSVCSLENLHIWMDCSLSLPLCSPRHVCFSVSFHVDWLLLHPSIFLSFPRCSLFLPVLLFSVWCVFDWEGCQPFLIGLLLHLMLADWLVWLASGDVMRSWLAACNLCMNSFDVFCIVLNWWICRLIHLLFPSFFKEAIKTVLDFFLNAFVRKYFYVLCSVCQWLQCVRAKLPDYSLGSLILMFFSFKRSACIKYHCCSLRILTFAMITIMTPHT